MHTVRNRIMGIIAAVLASLANLCHLVPTLTLVIEQARTGFGFGTNLEIGVLYPWLVELLLLPVLVYGAVYLIVCRRAGRALYFTNAALISLILLQYVLTNLFIFY